MLKPGDKIQVKVLKRKKWEIKDARIVQVCARHIIVDYGQYRDTISLFDLRRGVIRLCKDGKWLRFKPLGDKRDEPWTRKVKKENIQEVREEMSKLTIEMLKKGIEEGKTLEDFINEGHNSRVVYRMATQAGIKRDTKEKTEDASIVVIPGKRGVEEITKKKSTLKPTMFRSTTTGFIYKELADVIEVVHLDDSGIGIRKENVRAVAQELFELADMLKL